MPDLLLEYGLFVAKLITLAIAILVMAGAVAGMSRRGRKGSADGLEVKHLNRRYESMARKLEHVVPEEKQLVRRLKLGAGRRRVKRHKDHAKRTFVLDFHGDLRASAVASLREEITAVLLAATPDDEVLLRLESAGGMVHAYGLAASQLLRFKDRRIPLTVAVDKIAASGGYLMACVADRILAAPFAILGSIGVVAQLPNFNRWLRENNIDFEQLTSGEYKRTLTLFGENTEADRQKARAEIEDTHALFKAFIRTHRSGVDIDKVATGEHWYGTRAIDLGLVDELRTSDDYLLAASQSRDLYQVKFAVRRGRLARLLRPAF
ncbi:MAG: protease SohB [Gammaproteobacteria bacterium]